MLAALQFSLLMPALGSGFAGPCTGSGGHPVITSPANLFRGVPLSLFYMASEKDIAS
jgi:hypothetical protein